jgi:hypothetical protein
MIKGEDGDVLASNKVAMFASLGALDLPTCTRLYATPMCQPQHCRYLRL